MKEKKSISFCHTWIIELLMSYFLDDDFKLEYLETPVSVHSEEYYVRTMIAWFFATVLAKQRDTTIKYIKPGRVDVLQ